MDAQAEYREGLGALIWSFVEAVLFGTQETAKQIGGGAGRPPSEGEAPAATHEKMVSPVESRAGPVQSRPAAAAGNAS